MFRIGTAALAAVWVFFASFDGNRAAFAADPMIGPSFYLSAFGGLTFREDARFYRSGTFESTLTHDPGGAGGIAAGYRWPMGLRADVELSYRRNRVDSQTSGGVTNYVSGVETHAFSYLVNAWYDIPTGTSFMPYLGGGIGGTTITFDNAGDVDNDTVFAWQLGGGVGFAMMSGIVFFADYRWLATQDMRVKPGAPPLEMEYSSHNLMFGVRVHL